MFGNTPSLPPFIFGRFAQGSVKTCLARGAQGALTDCLRQGLRAVLLMAGMAVLTAQAASAHEFWIDPQVYTAAKGDPLVADIRVGTEFKGAPYSYVERNFERFDVLQDGAVQPVPGRAGDRPALNYTSAKPGLATIVHVTRDYMLTYSKWEKFETFTAHKDATWALQDHLDRGLSQEKFRERYSRHAKSLMAVGHGRGTDVEAGLLTEIVAEANPYTDDLSTGFPLRVLYKGAPRAEAQVEVFDRAPGGEVVITLYRTDAEGRARIATQPGHSYLVDSVVLRPLEPVEDNDPVWESLWASLTFAVPE